MPLISLSKLSIACSSSFRRAVIGQVKSRDQIGFVANFFPERRILNQRVASLRSYCCNQVNKNPTNSSMLSSCHVFARISMAGLGSATVTGDGHITGCGIDFAKPAVVFFGDRSSRSCRKAGLSLRNLDAPCSHLGVLGVSNKSWDWDSRPFIGPCLRHYHASCSQSNGAAADVSFDGSVRDEQLKNSSDPTARKQVGPKTLKLRSGSFYLPHPDKVKTGGEDAHFICEEKQVIGVADGVGGWADVGVDAGQYARLLMFNSQTALKEEPKGSVDPAKVLEKAHADTKVIGSSTACIVALTDKGIHAINLGDSAFIVIRDGTTVFRSPVQQYGFNFPYQLASGTGGDLPSAGQVFTFPVASGDVIVAGTDGLFDNLYDNEIVALVVQAMRSGIEPLITAQNIATLAQQRALDRHRQTPFSAAAHDAGIRYFGGKLDDITVVVSYITDENNL